MPEIFFREAVISHAAFQLCRIRKTAIHFTVPDNLTVDINDKIPPVPGTRVTEAKSVLKL
jgi:hypothetical protein